MAGKRVVEIFGTKFIIVRGPPWTYKKAKFPILKRYNLPKPLQPGPLGEQQAKLIAAATKYFGQHLGKVTYHGVSMPAVAVKIGQEIRGSTGGHAKEMARNLRHEEAQRKLSAFRSGGYTPAAPAASSSSYYPPYP